MKEPKVKELTRRQILQRRLAKKKTYSNYLRNQRLRRADPNIRQIRGGEVISTGVSIERKI